MPTWRTVRGTRGEAIARHHLEGLGYSIVEANFRCPAGEIDLVAHHGDCLVFVEVRTRRSLNYGPPEESLTPSKMKRLIASAETYLQAHPDLATQWRIDVVAIEMGAQGQPVRIEVIENAIPSA